jgi:hypothetical protein
VTWVRYNLILVHLETMLVSMQIGAQFALNIPYTQKSFSQHPMELLGDVSHMESHFSPLETVLVSVQDRYTVCAK